MTSPTTLRLATLADTETLAQFARDAFVAAFGTLYAAEDLAAFLAQARSQASYRAHLADPKKRICLAERDGQIAGYALIVLGEGFPERPAPQPAGPVMLSQLYCGADTTGLGIGAALMQWVQAEARGWGADAIQLSVYSENTGAQRFYARHGFAHVADLDFWVGNKRDDEFLYELSLG
ncbi:GNAT family N-acetyltransferase [Croceibacterium xixiisoli]|uniref:GNAT family N-acetyltransferase n=1 Tax=Croceibacterium xixiisoli TaxID=1476466 RepID=UPI002E2538C6